MGPHNVYDIYDNCPATEQWLSITGKSMRWLRKTVRDRSNPTSNLLFRVVIWAMLRERLLVIAVDSHGPNAHKVLDAELKTSALPFTTIVDT